MNLPTQAQVKAATRHIASAAGGIILMFGLSSKIDPDTLAKIIAQTGTIINDVIILIGLAGPVIAGWRALQSASPTEQAVTITKEGPPGTIVVTSDAIAKATPEAPNVVSKDDMKVVSK
jgi:hypothetical protein